MLCDSLTIKKALKSGCEFLSLSTLPQLEADLLLSMVLNVPRTYLYTHSQQILNEKEKNSFLKLLKRRQQGEPIAYLLGHKEFWSLDFEVNASTLIPRPETEILVQWALNLLPSTAICLAELGTGSGAIAIALALERPNWKIFATEISPQALAVADKNKDKHHVKNMTLIVSDWCKALPIKNFDAIVSNPPYLAGNDTHLEDLKYEPISALVSDPDGLTAIRTIISEANDYLKPGGLLLIEHGYNQADIVRALFRNEGYTKINSYPDLNEILRVTCGVKSSYSKGE